MVGAAGPIAIIGLVFNVGGVIHSADEGDELKSSVIRRSMQEADQKKIYVDPKVFKVSDGGLVKMQIKHFNEYTSGTFRAEKVSALIF